MSKEKKTLTGLLVGIIVYIVLITIVGVILTNNKWQFVLGTIWSGLGAAAVTIHLYFSLQKSLDLDEDSAVKRERMQAMIRMVIMIVVIGSGLFFSQVFHPLGVVLGAFALKVSAYMQPLFHNYFSSDTD
ncbi:MAG: hypothetical protein HFJ09_06285 [Lachnospiraceae bacterium]|nr:hypothetical protein [Lachnospiraceae bacterium]